MELFSFSKNELSEIKGAAILLVLLGHLQMIVKGGSAGVALFLIASGYGLSESAEAHGLKGYWHKRIRKVYLPYFLMACIHVAAKFPCGLKKAAITLLGLDFGCNLDSTMWYISYIFLWYAVFYLLYCFTQAAIRHRTLRDIVQILMMFAAGWGTKNLNGIAFSTAPGMPMYAFFFPMGVAVSKLGHSQFAGKWNRHSGVILAVVLAMCSSYQLRRYALAYNFAFVVTMAFLVICIIRMIPLHPVIKKCLTWLGKYSYGIYLWEGLLIWNGDFFFPGLENAMAMNIAAILLSIFAGFVFMEGICSPIMSAMDAFERHSPVTKK